MNSDSAGGIFALVVIVALVTLAVFETRSERREAARKCVVAFSKVHVASDTTAILLVSPECGEVLRGAR